MCDGRIACAPHARRAQRVGPVPGQRLVPCPGWPRVLRLSHPLSSILSSLTRLIVIQWDGASHIVKGYFNDQGKLCSFVDDQFNKINVAILGSTVTLFTQV